MVHFWLDGIGRTTSFIVDEDDRRCLPLDRLIHSLRSIAHKYNFNAHGKRTRRDGRWASIAAAAAATTKHESHIFSVCTCDWQTSHRIQIHFANELANPVFRLFTRKQTRESYSNLTLFILLSLRHTTLCARTENVACIVQTTFVGSSTAIWNRIIHPYGTCDMISTRFSRR